MKQFNSGNWTASRMNQFIRSALRGARWGPKYEAIKKAYVKNGINPRTGRKCKLHLCSQCRNTFPQNGVQADHIEPVIGPEGFVSWDVYISRLFVEADGFRVLCKECHRKVTMMERFKTDEEGLKKRDALRAFRALKIHAKHKLLKDLGIENSGTAKSMELAYSLHINHSDES